MSDNLTISEKIEILTNAKELCKIDSCKYMCIHICDAVCQHLNVNYSSVKGYEKEIDLFTRENAYKVCKAKGVTLPRTDNSAWWHHYEEEARMVFFDWMIEEYKKKL